MEYSKIDTESLRQMFLAKAWSKRTPDEEIAFESLRDELNKRETNPVKTSDRQETNFKQKEMKISIENVPKFSPGHDVTLFIAKLANLFALFEVETNGTLEAAFVRSSKARLCEAYLTELVNSKTQTATFAELQCYLTETFESKT